MDDSNDLEAKWPKLKEKVKEQYPHLSEDDLALQPGKEEELLLRLQEKLNRTKHDIRNWLHILG